MKLESFALKCDLKIDDRLRKLEVKGIAYDSRKVKRDYLFVAIKGYNTDGHRYIKDALNRGASVIIAQEGYKSNLKNLPIIYTSNSRKTLACVSAYYYNNPSLKLNLIGITGTNGKTTTSYLIDSILKNNGENRGLIGTIKYVLGNESYAASTTTPQSLDLQYLFYRMLKKNIEYATMEVSSHSLYLNRVDFCNFKVAIFTNLSEDHFDFHKNYQDYFKAKSLLFEHLKNGKIKNKIGIINIDDKWGNKLYQLYKEKLNLITFGLGKDASVRADDIRYSMTGTEFTIIYRGKRWNLMTRLIGKFNIYNILAAFSCAKFLGIKTDIILDAITKFKPPAGRMEILRAKDGYYIGIDYAHTDDALKNVLTTLKEIVKGRIITVFGCGGDRDKNKRAKMGKVAASLSDITIITSDNPRTENPVKIISEIEEGFIRVKNSNYYKITDREKAIKKGVSLAKRDDFLLIAGKGHEDYQIIGKVKKPFNDKVIVKKFINII